MYFKNKYLKLSPETILAMNTAIKAGKSILPIYKKNFSISFKKDGEPVTEADLKSNQIIFKELSKLKYPIISEENEDMEGSKHNKIWIIDPLDGTSDFVDKTGEFSVMIGFVKDHVPVVGVIYQPTIDSLYVAQQGYGAYQIVDGEWSRLFVNDRSQLNECRAIVSRHHLSEQEKTFLNQLNTASFVQRGSCGLKIAEICRGGAELYFTTTDKIKQWDTCAAYCLIKEAGGMITDMFGNHLEYNTRIINHQRGILVTNGMVHSKVIREYKNFYRS